nr:MAG TPA: hypothetical protein [Caudoviricetes sp.]
MGHFTCDYTTSQSSASKSAAMGAQLGRGR